MNTDINKQIEEEAREYSNYALAQDGYIKGYNACLNSSRWRKVSEELPDIGIWVNVKDSENDIDCIHITTEFELKAITNYYKFWKPID